MKRLIYRLSAVSLIACGASSAFAYHFSVDSLGTYTMVGDHDTENVLFAWNLPTAATTLDLDGPTQTGVLTGSGGNLDFNFVVNGVSLYNGGANETIQWTYSNASTGVFAGLKGGGSISIDFLTLGGPTSETTSGMTGNLAPVPEPASLAALGIGAVSLIRRRRRLA